MISDFGLLLRRLGECAMNITTDSREVSLYRSQGRKVMFCALKGERFDGNNFAMQAIEDGATYVIADAKWLDEKEDSRLLLVEDSLKALQGLAREYRRTLKGKVVAITGSNGKTTTKELVGRVLAQKYSVYCTEGNLNNHIGVPLSLLRIPSDTDIAVIEMGANHKGEIRDLCLTAEPDFGLITNVGKAHLDGFGGFVGVKKGKGELIDFLHHRGLFFYLAEDKDISGMAEARVNLKKISYSVKGVKASISADGLLKLLVPDFEPTIKTNLVGEFNKYNILSALALGRYFGIELKDAIKAIEAYIPSNHRSQLTITAKGNHITLDCYNANPSSMEGALRGFCNTKSERPKVVILGDMMELGKFSAAEHRKIVENIVSCGFSAIYLIGANYSAAVKEVGSKGIKTYITTEGMAKHIMAHPITESTIFIKGSHSIALQQLVENL